MVVARGETGGAEVETEGAVAGVLLLLILQLTPSHRVGFALNLQHLRLLFFSDKISCCSTHSSSLQGV